MIPMRIKPKTVNSIKFCLARWKPPRLLLLLFSLKPESVRDSLESELQALSPIDDTEIEKTLERIIEEEMAKKMRELHSSLTDSTVGKI